MTGPRRTWTLLGSDRRPFESKVPGTLGGNGRARIYGRLDCASALRALREGGYAEYRVFFLDADSARAAGFRPCGTCLRDEYTVWKAAQS
jgi:hypothetical protein